MKSRTEIQRTGRAAYSGRANCAAPPSAQEMQLGHRDHDEVKAEPLSSDAVVIGVATTSSTSIRSAGSDVVVPLPRSTSVWTSASFDLSMDRKRRRVLCFGCCSCTLVLGLAALLVAVLGIIVPLSSRVRARFCEVRLCTEEPAGACPESTSALEATLNVLLVTRVYNPSIFDLGLTRVDVSATLKGHGDRVSPQRTADATASAGAMVGCVLADSDESHNLPSKGWASVTFYCEVALVNATGESLKLLIRNDSLTLELGYSAAGKVGGLPATHNGFFEYTAGGDSDFRDVDNDDDEEACRVDDLTTMVLDPLREAAQVELCALRICTGGLAAIEADGGAACAASLEAHADETGTLALAVGIQVYNPTTVRLHVTALHLAISLDGVAPTPASTELASVQQMGALAGCELDSAATMPALAWGVLNASCELRLGDETGAMLSALLDNRSIELWASYSIDAEVVGVTLQNEGTLGRNWSLAQVTGDIAGGSTAAAIAAPDCGDPFAEVDAMLKLPLINLTTCGTNTSGAFDGVVEQVAGLLGTGSVMNAVNCRELRPALIELCAGLKASEMGIGDDLHCPCEASESASFLSASALGLAFQVIQCSVASGGRRLDGVARRLDQASCDELTASVTRNELSVREEFDLHNPSHLNITLDAAITFRDEYGRLVGTADVVKFSVRGPATEAIFVDIDVRYALARAIVDAAQMRWIMCLMAEPSQPRPECDSVSDDLTADVSVMVEWLGTSVIVPMEPVVVQASSLFAPSTNCSCFVGSDDTCLQDISGLTLASMYEAD